MDDLYKEMVVTSLPIDVQRAMTDKLESLNAQQTADLADSYFDKDGKVLLPSSSINSVGKPLLATETAEDDADVNAVNGRPRFPPRQQGAKKGPRKFGGKGPSANNPSTSTSAFQQPRQQQDATLQQICPAHLKYGDKAYSCVKGCSMWDKHQLKKGNGNAGSRS